MIQRLIFSKTASEEPKNFIHALSFTNLQIYINLFSCYDLNVTENSCSIKLFLSVSKCSLHLVQGFQFKERFIFWERLRISILGWILKWIINNFYFRAKTNIIKHFETNNKAFLGFSLKYWKWSNLEADWRKFSLITFKVNKFNNNVKY